MAYILFAQDSTSEHPRTHSRHPQDAQKYFFLYQIGFYGPWSLYFKAHEIIFSGLNSKGS